MSKVTTMARWHKNREADRKIQLVIDHMKEISQAYRDASMYRELRSKERLVSRLIIASDSKGESK